MNKPFSPCFRIRFFIACIGASLAFQSLFASVTWVGGGADNNWSTPANWSDNAVPTAATAVEIAVTGEDSPTIAIVGTVQCASLTINKSATSSDADARLRFVGEKEAYLDVNAPVESTVPVAVEGDLAISDVKTGTYAPQETATLRLKQRINKMIVSTVGSIRAEQKPLPEGYAPTFQGKGTILLDETEIYRMSYTSLVVNATFKNFAGTLALENGARLLNYQKMNNVAEDLDPFPSGMTLSFKNAAMSNNTSYVAHVTPLHLRINSALRFEDDGTGCTNRLELGRGIFNLAGSLKGDGNARIWSWRNGTFLSGDNSAFKGRVDLAMSKDYMNGIEMNRAMGLSGLAAGSPHAVFEMNSSVTNLVTRTGIAYRLDGKPTAEQSELHLGAIIATNSSAIVRLEPGLKIVIGEREDVKSRLACKFYMNTGYYDATLIKKGKGVLEFGRGFGYESTYTVKLTKVSPVYCVQEGTLALKMGVCGHITIEKGAVLDIYEQTDPTGSVFPILLWSELGCRSRITSKGGLMRMRMKYPLSMAGGVIDTSEGCHLIIDIDEMPQEATTLIKTVSQNWRRFTREELSVIEIRVKGQRPVKRPSLFIMEDGSIGLDPKPRGALVIVR